MEIKSNKVYYSELPSRNVYVDSVVNDLPGYYPARSEFNIEYDNDIEQDLTDVCVLYDEVMCNRGEEESDDEEDPLKILLAHVKKEQPEIDNEVEKSSSSAKFDLSRIPGDTLKRKKKNVDDCEDSHEMKKRKSNPKQQAFHQRVTVRQEINPHPGECSNKEACHENESDRERGKKITEEDKNVLEVLCTTAIDIYNNRLRKRNARKAFVRNHGFLDQKKIYSWYNIHNLELGDGLFSVLLKKFIKLFSTAYEFDMFIQQLKLEKELKAKLNYLTELRSNGIRHKKLIPLYTKLKESRNKMHAEIRNVDIGDILVLSSFETPQVVAKTEQRKFKKLEISHLQNFRCLNEEEKELCSNARLTPVSYLNFKQLMIDECRKLGALKLAQARTLLKIDVNKTRKVYNYLIEKKLIWTSD